MKKIITPKEFKEKKKEITEARRQEILRLKNEEGWTQKKIAEYFEIDESLVSRIIRGER